MTRYLRATNWIALNDGAADREPPAELAKNTTVVMVADIFDRSVVEVAENVYRVREAAYRSGLLQTVNEENSRK